MAMAAKSRKTAQIARALGHPVRLEIVRILSRQDGCYAGRLADLLPVAPATLSQHLKLLCKSGLVKQCVERPRIKYCIKPEALEEARRLLNDALGRRK